MADAGCILQSLSEYVAPHNHIMPLDLGAKGRYVSALHVLEPFIKCPLVQVVKLVAMYLQMQAVSDSSVTVHSTAPSSVWRSSCQMVPSWTSYRP